MHRLTILLYLTGVLLLSGGNISAQGVKDAFTKKTLPDVEIQTIDGRAFNINSLGKRGNIVIINFWATWCGPCKLELNTISELYDDWKKDYNVELYAVSIDDSRNTGKVKAMVNGQGWPFNILLDPNQELQRAFNFQAPPFTVVVDQNGYIVSTHTGYKSGDEMLLEEKLMELKK